MSLVYKIYGVNTTTNKNSFKGNVSSDNLSETSGGGIYDGYFHFIKANNNKLTISPTAYDDYYESWNKNIFIKFIPTSLTESYDIFYQDNGEAGLTNKKLYVYITNGTLYFELNLGGTVYTTSRADFLIAGDLGVELCCWFGFNRSGNNHNTYVFKNESQFASTTTIYSNATAVDFTSVELSRTISFNETGNINDSYYVKDIVLGGAFPLTLIDNYQPYLNDDILPTTASEIVYTMANQDYSTTVINSGSAESVGDGTIVDETDFYVVDPVIVNGTSYHKMFDNNVHNNILSTENISTAVTPYTIPSCEYLYDRVAIMRERAREEANIKTNYTFCYDINDDYYTNYMCVGTRQYVPWFFLYDSRDMVDSTIGYCSNIDVTQNNIPVASVITEYTLGTWMTDFKRKLFGTHKTTAVELDGSVTVQLHRDTKTYSNLDTYLHTYYRPGYVVPMSGITINELTDSVFNICGDYWGMPHAHQFIDVIDKDYTGHRYFDLRISNNDTVDFNQIGTNTFTYEFSSWNYKTVPLRWIKTSADYYKKINPSAMRVVPGTYQAFFDYEQSLLRNTDNTWNLIPFKKVVTLGYFVFITDTLTNKFTIYDTYIDYNDDEIDMTGNPSTDSFIKFSQQSSYKFFTLPNTLSPTQEYVISPIYSNIILAGQTSSFPTYKQVDGAPDRMEFNGIVPTKTNETKLVPKTKAKIHFKKIK